MNKEINELEDIQIDLDTTKDLNKILDEHFQASRYKDSTLDHLSIERLFKEYGTLNWVISSKLNDMEEKLSKTITKMNDKES